MRGKCLIVGQTARFAGNPFELPVSEAVRHQCRGGILVEGGKIVALGDAGDLAGRNRDAVLHDYGDDLVLPGFIDAHVHYPQTAIIASWGARLLDWLNNYTFPEEMKFADPDYASDIAANYLDTAIDCGTTTVCSYCTTHPESVDAIFREAGQRGMRLAAGKVCMDMNAPKQLCDSAQQSYDQSRRLLEDWHGQGRLSYVITPRFAVTSSRGQLEALGALWREFPDCLMQTHIAEQPEEVAEVARLHPAADDYLEVYESAGLLGRNGLYGHAIHLQPRELGRFREVGAALIHCPTSNTFVGSGLFDLQRRTREGQRVGLASDIGGGSSFSMLRTMAAAYEIGQLNGSAIHPGQLIWLATQGNAMALNMERVIGNLAIGNEADIVVLNLRSTPAIAQRASRAEDFWEELFPTIMMGDDRAIRSVWINGSEVRNDSAQPVRNLAGAGN